MFIFKEYNPLKRTFTDAQSENSTTSSPLSTPPPQTLHVRTPEAPKPPSLPSSAVRHASNALLVLGGYVSNAFQQFTASVSRSPRRSHPLPPLLPLSLHDESLSPTGLSFSSADSFLTHNRQATPTPSSRQATGTNPHATPPIRQTTPEAAALESGTRDSHNILHDGSDEYAPISYPNIGDPPLSDENEDTCAPVRSEPKRRGRKVNPTFMNPPQGELLHPCIN
jgi:hypothetical protein